MKAAPPLLPVSAPGEEWLTELRLRTADICEPGLHVTVQFRVEGAPGQSGSFYWKVHDGRLIEAVGGELKDPPLIVTLSTGRILADVLVGGPIERAVFRREVRLQGSMLMFANLDRLRAHPAWQAAWSQPRARTTASDPDRSEASARGEDERGTLPADLPQTARWIEAGLSNGRILGLQLYVSVGGQSCLDAGVGVAAGEVSVRRDSVMPWRCAGKPLVAAAVAKLSGLCALALDQPVARYVCVLADRPHGAVTLRQLLQHRVRFLDDPPVEALLPIDGEDLTAALDNAKLDPDWPPGSAGSYSRWTAWALLGEAVRQVDGRVIGSHVRDEICAPLGLRDTWLGMTRSAYRGYGPLLVGLVERREERSPWQALRDSEDLCEISSAPDGVRGPIRELGYFYESLLGLRSPTLEQVLGSDVCHALVTSPSHGHDAGPRKMFGRQPRWGLGLLCDGSAIAPCCSTRTVGHLSMDNVVSFADPKYGLVVAMAFTDLLPERESARRSRRAIELIYRDILQ